MEHGTAGDSRNMPIQAQFEYQSSESRLDRRTRFRPSLGLAIQQSVAMHSGPASGFAFQGSRVAVAGWHQRDRTGMVVRIILALSSKIADLIQTETST